jgi:hypothetical protein
MRRDTDIVRFHGNVNIVEILVIVSIICVMIALLIPAIMAARDSAAKDQKQQQVVNQPLQTRICKVVALKEEFIANDSYGQYVFRVHVVYSKSTNIPSSDVELMADGDVDVLVNMLSSKAKINCEIIQANLKIGQWYVLRLEYPESGFPNIIEYQAIPHITFVGDNRR